MNDSKPAIEIRRAGARFRTLTDWLDARHSFNFGQHQHPVDRAHGLLIVNNEDRVAPGRGFGRHGHSDMEIVTWVLDGALEHRDSVGNHGLITPGIAQRMSAGTGIEHSETNPSETDVVHLIQMWVPPDRAGLSPSYAQHDFTDALESGGLVPIASGMGHEGALVIHQGAAALWIGRIDAPVPIALPDARWLHVFVARGSIDLAGHALTAGDAARIADASGLAVTSPDHAEIIVWQSETSVA